MAQRKNCTRCGVEFAPSTKVDQKSWDRRQFCGRDCAARGVMERPDVKVRQQAATKERFKDPTYRERHARAARVNVLKATLVSNRQKAGAAHTQRVLGWIPLDMRTRYVRLRERHGALEAKTLIRLEIEERRIRTLDHELAANHLRRLASVYRCDRTGKPSPAGTHWRYGTRVLERVEVIRLALQKGASPEALAA